MLGGTFNSYVADNLGQLTVSTTQLDGKTSSSTTDATGKVIRSVDSGNGITEYKYFSHDGLRKIDITTAGGSPVEVSSMTYDVAGRQTQLIEPNSGTTNYNYNAFGELIYQKDNKDAIVKTFYDDLGRVDKMTVPEGSGIIDYHYVVSGNGLNEIQKIRGYDKTEESFTYDTYHRVLEHTEIINQNEINERSFTHSYEYDDYSRLKTTTYSSGLQISNIYDGIESLVNIYEGTAAEVPAADDIHYTAQVSNNYGQMTQYLLGNGHQTNLTYNEYSILSGINTTDPSIFDMTFDFNDKNSNLNSRTDNRLFIMETFMYDEFNRLKTANHPNHDLTMMYEPNGNIKMKDDVSAQPYKYRTDKIHAVEEIHGTQIISPSAQDILYDSAEQPTRIIENGYTLDLSYGADRQRRYTTLSNGSTIYERY